MSGFAEEMAEYDDTWNETETQPPLFSDGVHQAKITICRVEENEKFGGWQWVIGLGGTDSNTNKHATIRKWHNLPPEEESMPYVKGDAARLGYHGPLSGLEAACSEGRFDDLLCEIKVVTKPGREDRDYTNVYINKVLGKMEPGQEPRPATTTMGSVDDDIPF